MKLSFQPDDPYSTHREFEIVRENEELFGRPVRKPQDPSIKSLLAFEEDLPSIKEVEKQKWLSEARDAYRGYFYSPSDSNYYRLKVESPSPYIQNPSIEQKAEENQVENYREEKPIEVQKVNKPGTKTEIKSSKKKEEQRDKPKMKINKPKTAQKQTKKENPRPLSSSKSVSALQKPSEKSKNDDGRIERQEARIKKLNQTTRWLPNSAFTTYFGKPAFANYGQGNVNPVRGGYLYGDYMKSHNLAPHEGKNDPEYAQVYKNAEIHGLKKKPRSPEPPRKCKDEDRLSPDQVEELKRRSQIIAEKKSTPSKKIIKPNLYEVKTFKSVHSTPNSSFEGEVKEEEEDLEKKNGKNEKVKNNSAKNEIASTDRSLVKTEKKPLNTQMKNYTQNKQVIAVSQPSEVPEINYEETQSNLLLPTPKQLRTQQSLSLPSQESLAPQVQISNSQKPIQLTITPDQTATGLISPSPGIKSEPPSLAEPNHQLPNQNFFTTTYKDMASKILYSPKFTSVLPLCLCEKCHEPITSELEIKPEDLCPPNSLSDMPFKELNPKNYKQLPPTFTKRIPAAGKLSYKSLSAYNVIFPES